MNERALEFLSHLLNAQAIWLDRIENKNPIYKVWEMHSVDTCEKINQENYNRSQALLKATDAKDLDTVIAYKNSKGIDFKNKIRDILFHIINHSTHHRAQISLILRQQGYDPPVSDYIFYKRDES